MRLGKQGLRHAHISFPLAVLLSVFVLLVSEYSYQKSTRLGAGLGAAIDARLHVQRVIRLMVDAESGQRGYLITGQAAYLEPYREASVQIDVALAAIRQRYLKVGSLAKQFEELEQRIALKRTEMQATVALRGAGDTGWEAIIAADIGLAHMKHIRDLGNQLIEREGRVIAAYQNSLHNTLMIARTGIAVMVVLGLLAFALYLRESNRNATLQEQHRIRLIGERNNLEHQVLQRTRRLRRLASYLQNVREDERARLARELHDELGALLVAAKLDLARLRSRIGNRTDPFIDERIRHLGDALNNGISLKRRIIEYLHPSTLNKLGLVAALEILAREFSERTGVVVSCDLQPVELIESRQLTCYRLVQEALTNASKYACATELRLRLQRVGRNAMLEIEDNGVGFDPTSTPASSHGLEGMQYRVESQGGTFTLDAAPRQGTRIRVSLPIGVEDLSAAA